MDVINIINALRKTDKSIEVIYMNGSCYRFHLFLKELYPNAIPYMSQDKDHVITKINNEFYDITGKVEEESYYPFTDDDFKLAEKWSFSRSRLLSLKDCPNCDEPILVGF